MPRAPVLILLTLALPSACVGGAVVDRRAAGVGDADDEPGVLVVVGSSRGIFGSDRMGLAMERFGNTFVSRALRSRYRVVLPWAESAGEDFPTFWRTVLTAARPGEPIDVFSMEHGGDVLLEDLLGELPEPGRIRRYYSTGCSNWGRLSVDPTTGSVHVSSTSSAARVLAEAGVRQYAIHANDNYGGLLQLPLALRAFREHDDDWVAGSVEASEQFDDQMATFVDDFIRLDDVLAYSELSDFMAADYLLAWREWLRSRLVVGGSEAPRLDDERVLHRGDFGDQVLAPSAALSAELTARCPGVFDSWGTCPTPPDGRQAEPTSADEVFVVGFVARLVEAAFAAASDTGDRCVSPAPAQELVDAYLSDSDGAHPELRSLCLRREAGNRWRLRWALGPTPEQRLYDLESTPVPSRPWTVGPVEDLMALAGGAEVTALHLEREGSIELVTHRSRFDVFVRGVGISLRGVGELAPFFTRNIGIRGLTVDAETGEYVIRLSQRILGLPLSLRGSREEGLTRAVLLGMFSFRIDDAGL